MKARIEAITSNFNPFELIIDVRNAEDLINLWAVFNSSVSTKVSNCSFSCGMSQVIDERTLPVFNALNRELEKQVGVLK